MKTSRDMVVTMGVVGIVVILVAWYGSHLSFGGLAPKTGPIPTADVTETFTNAHPDVPVFTGAIDRELDGHGYIRPGLGDAGDSFYGTR